MSKKWANPFKLQWSNRVLCVIIFICMLTPFIKAQEGSEEVIQAPSPTAEIAAPGVLEYVCIEDAPGGTGNPVGDVLINYPGNFTFYAVGYDSEGGFVQDLNLSWGFHRGMSTSIKNDLSAYTYEPEDSDQGVESYWISVEDLNNDYDFPNEYNETGNITVWWTYPDPEINRTVSIFVDDGVYLGPDNIQANLTRYINDIENDPYKPYTVKLYTGTWADDTDIKPLIMNDYLNNNLKGVVFIGQIPTPLMEGIGPFGYELKPVDYYYMDLDGSWGDSDGDGYWNWSETSGEHYSEIFCGRMSPDCITGATGKSEKWLINNYLQKDHDYRTGVYVTNKSGYSCARNNNDDVWENIFPDTVHQLYLGTAQAAQEFNDHMTDGHEGVYIEVHGSETTHEPMAYINYPNQFIVLASCECANYSASNNVATRYSFAPDHGLVTFATSTYCQSGVDLISFPYLENYRTMGEASMAMTRHFYTFDGLHTMGDPLLRTSEPTWDTIEIETKGYIKWTNFAERGDLIANVLLRPGEHIDLHALGCVDSGNTIRGDAYVTWTTTGTLDGIDPTPCRWIRYEPVTDQTSGTIVVDDSFGHTNVVNVYVDSTLLDHIKIRDAPNGGGSEVTTVSMTADDEITLYAAGYDSGNQYLADIKVTWDTTGTLDPVPSGISTHVTFSPSTAPTSGTITCDDGYGFSDATGLVTVGPGAFDRIQIRDAPFGGGSVVGNRSITTDETMQLWAAEADSEDNYIADRSCTWITGGNLIPAVPNGPSTSTLFTPTSPGNGWIFADDGNGNVTVTGNITVELGEVAEVKIVQRPASGAPGTIVLWPNRNGAHSDLMPGFDNWDIVNDNPPTDYAMGQFIRAPFPPPDWGYDLYQMDQPTSISGPIDEVRVYFRISSRWDSPGMNGTPMLYLDGQFTNGTAQPHALDAFATYSQALSRPGGGNWTFDDICRLQAGLNISNPLTPWDACCSQLYVTVNFTADTELGDRNMAVLENLNLAAVGYDADGNLIGEVECTWGITGSLDPVLPGPSSTLTFTPITPLTVGTITADDGNSHTDDTGTITVSEASCDILLEEGWNLMSFPLIQIDESIDRVLLDIDGKWDVIQVYDPLNPIPWASNATYKPYQLNDICSLNHTVGFWINITEPSVQLTVWGSLPTSVQIPLYGGWNLVGYPAQTQKTITEALVGTGYTRVEGFNSSCPYGLEELQDTYLMNLSEAYWIYVPADTTWTVDW